MRRYPGATVFLSILIAISNHGCQQGTENTSTANEDGIQLLAGSLCADLTDDSIAMTCSEGKLISGVSLMRGTPSPDCAILSIDPKCQATRLAEHLLSCRGQRSCLVERYKEIMGSPCASEREPISSGGRRDEYEDGRLRDRTRPSKRKISVIFNCSDPVPCVLCGDDETLKGSTPLADGSGRTCDDISITLVGSDSQCGEHRGGYRETCCEPRDQCPEDPDKIEPGECGCGVADMDSDGDLIADCNDGCPEDPNKNEPGECGCGMEEGTCGHTDDTCTYQTYDTSREAFAKDFCCLCADCYFALPDRMGLVVNAEGLTCSDIEVDMFDQNNESRPGTETCQEMQNTYRDVCCNPTCTPPPIDVDWEPVEPPFPQGSQPLCDLCLPGNQPNGQFPQRPYTYTAVSGLPGNPTCQDLYWMGRTGNIPGATCYPLQLNLGSACGCSAPDPERYPSGTEPWCDLCPSGHYPLRPHINPGGLADLGTPSCNDLYYKGRTGAITASQCLLLQEEVQDSCGCLPE